MIETLTPIMSYVILPLCVVFFIGAFLYWLDGRF